MNTKLTQLRTVAPMQLMQLGASTHVLPGSGISTSPSAHATTSTSAAIGDTGFGNTGFGNTGIGNTGIGATSLAPNAVLTYARVRDAKQAAPPRGELH